METICSRFGSAENRFSGGAGGWSAPILPQFWRNFVTSARCGDLPVAPGRRLMVSQAARVACLGNGCDTAMSRFLHQSVTADLAGRLFNLMLFLTLYPFVWLLSQRRETGEAMPEARVRPRSALP
ncbi:hypothetical protein [Paragemmobacter ruber]|uniref:Uncharacterized protein n=1 Tax=Paragemmobacter ruber TaxID=1985673 RepID=A0ABW9Y1I3_9RHOB|nr:hypothetical protein [Rhodobacter ruber]NBE05996.1 hypothetical protein [Rhodobacter ruber]